jgi:hypothetical protein
MMYKDFVMYSQARKEKNNLSVEVALGEGGPSDDF